MLKQVVMGLGIISTLSLTGCGDTPGKKTPGAPKSDEVYVPITGTPKTSGSSATVSGSGSTSTSTSTSSSGGSTALFGTTATTPFALTNVKDTSWESTCYRFSSSGDYSKKYWSFTADTITSLLVKYSDDACKTPAKNTDGSARVWTTWVIGTLSTTPNDANFAIVKGTCIKGCTAEYSTAMRASADRLDEGSKVSTTDTYNTADGKFTSSRKSKTFLDLEALATSISAGVVPPSTNGNTSTTAPTAPVTPPVPAAPSTGFGLIASLAGQSWTTCYKGTNTEGTVKVDRGFKRSLRFAKGAELSLDGYTSELTVMSNIDCTGDVISVKNPLSYSNLLVSKAAIEGWILVETRLCGPASCSAVKSLMKLPSDAQGLAEAGENKTAASFYTDTPRVYTLNP